MKIRTFRRQCRRPRLRREAASRELCDALLRPAQAETDAAERLLVCADGPLHTLPFAALVTSPAGQPGRSQIEARPLQSVASATVYQRLRRESQPPSPTPTLLTVGEQSGQA